MPRSKLLPLYISILFFVISHSFAYSQGFSYGKWTTVAEITKAANEGDVEAEFAIGLAYYYGLEVQKDKKLGLYWFQLAAEKGNTMAQQYLIMHYFGNKDFTQALYWLQKRAEQGDKGSEYELGLQYFDIDHRGITIDYQKGLYWLKRAAEHGENWAKTMLFTIYNYGVIGKKDQVQAQLWYEKAVIEDGQQKIDYSIGTLFEGGLLVRQNYEQAAYWFQRSAGLGYPPAQAMLGRFYREGTGVLQDYVLAYKWFNLAASKYEESMASFVRQLRDKLAEDMTHSQIEEAQKLTREWQPIQKNAVQNISK